MNDRQRRIILSERDIAVLEFCFRYRCAISKTIAVVCGFKSIGDCEKRLRILSDFNLIKREKIIYGLPYIYTITKKGMSKIGIDFKEYEINIGTLEHEIGIAEIMSYLYITMNLTFDDLITDRDMIIDRDVRKRQERIHKGDLIYTGKKIIVFEYERTRKTIKKLEKNFRSNINRFDEVWYFYDLNMTSIKKHLETLFKKYHKDSHILDMSTVRKAINEFNLKENSLRRNPSANRKMDLIHGRGFSKDSNIGGSWRDKY